MVRKILLPLLAVFVGALVCNAQDQSDKKVSVMLDSRFDAVASTYIDSDKEGKAGFGGKFITLVVDGQLTDKLSYAYRQRLFMDHGSVREFFNATDWMYLKYSFHKNMFVSAGKEVINVGGFEYDANPIDVYFYSDFWGNLTGAYQFGGTFGFISDSKNHVVKAQVTNSPFSTAAYDGRFAYNLLWSGTMGKFTSLYSVNLIETHRKGHYLNYIALGNRFNLDPVRIDFDYTNRYAVGERQKGFFSDFSVNCNVTWMVSDHFNVFVKGGYDQNFGQDASVVNVEDQYDMMVKPGRQYTFYGVGMEYFPIKDKKDLRIHAFWYSDSDKPTPMTFNVGVRWRMRLLSK